MGCGASKSKDRYSVHNLEPSTTLLHVSPDVNHTVHTTEDEDWRENNEAFSRTLEFLLKLPLMARLPRSKYPMLAARCTYVDFPPDAKILTNRDIFAVVRGIAAVAVDDGNGQSCGCNKSLVDLGEFDCFRQHHRFLNVTLVAVTSVTCLRIPQKPLEELGLHHPFGPNHNVLQDFGSSGWNNLVSYTGVLRNTKPGSFFKQLLLEETLDVAAACMEWSFSKGQNVIKKGDLSDSVYVVYNCELSLSKGDPVEPNKSSSSTEEVGQGDIRKNKKMETFCTKVAPMERGIQQNSSEDEADEMPIFGDYALLFREPQPMTVQVKSDGAKALKLSRAHFELLDTFRTVLVQRRTKEKRDEIGYEDLKMIGFLGFGSFAAVGLVQHIRATKLTTFAFKSVSKGCITKTGMQRNLFNERNALIMTNSHFIVKLHWTYNRPQHMVFLLDALLGGELLALYQKNHWHGSEKHAKYYIASWVCALEHLHARYIVCRGVKPEDCVVDNSGRMKVVDMGLVKFTMGKTYTMCGAPDYSSPEMISSTGHGKASDWWALGILIFELMFGHPPFQSSYPLKTYDKVMKGLQDLEFPSHAKSQNTNIIQELLKTQPDQRMPMRNRGVSKLKNHSWFDGFDWQGLSDQTLQPPYVPNIESLKDLSNFSVSEKDKPQAVEYAETGDHWDKDFAWTYSPQTPVELQVLDEDNPEMSLDVLSLEEENPRFPNRTFSSDFDLHFFSNPDLSLVKSKLRSVAAISKG